MAQHMHSIDRIVSTIPIEPAVRPPGGKIEVRARLVIPAHTSSRYNTELEKNIMLGTF